MLPNRMNLFKSTEDYFKKMKQETGLTPNIAARLAFMRSVERGVILDPKGRRVDGAMSLDKTVWFGEHLPLYELLLAFKYPDLDEKDLEVVWAAHVEDGRDLPLYSKTSN